MATKCLYAHVQRLHRRFLQEEWDRLHQVRIQTFINNMRIRIEACGGPTRYWFSLLDNVCVWSVCLSCEIVTFSTWPALIKCAVKLTLFFQFRWKLVWMFMNGSSPLRYHIISHYLFATGIDSYRWTTCVCDRCVLAVKLIIDPTLIKCAVKLTLFVQFRWKCVWMCMNDSSLPRYQIISHMLIQVLILVTGQCWCVCDRCV